MEKIITYLKQLELSEIEAKLYLTLLKTGPISVRKLAASSEMKRTTSYLYIDQLIERGLIIKVVKGSHKLVAATDPKDGIEFLVKKKVESANEVKKNFPTILEALVTSVPDFAHVDDAEIRYYKGKNGVKTIYEEALKSKEVRSFVDITEIAEAFPENIELFNKAFKNNPDLTIYEIVEDSPLSRSQMEKSKDHGRSFYKLMPHDMKLEVQDILIYEDKVAIINLKDKINAVVLHNTYFYNNFRLLFEFIWKVLP